MLIEELIKLRGNKPNPNAVKWVETIYRNFPANPLNDDQRVAIFGDKTNPITVLFELRPLANKRKIVELAWIQSYPLKSGGASRMIEFLKKRARDADITLELHLRTNGEISTAQLEEIYTKLGFEKTPNSNKMTFENINESTDIELKEKYARWKILVNMPSATLKKFIDSDTGKEAGLSRSEASELGIKSGRDSARAILRMREKPLSEWSPEDIKWMNRQISFVSRMTGNRGPLFKVDSDGKKIPTRKLTSLWIWGNSPDGHSPVKYGIFK